MAGETALARQLKKLAVPQTTVLIQDKIRKSFLFDHRDAAGLDREVVFAFGTTGLQKLCTINPLFSKFSADLFSPSYMDFQRSVQNSSANKKLDAKISEFLRMLSPYFLLRDAHEALEWLLYRFHIHLYNVDDLIASVIPHHNTSTFVRVVQLLDLDEKSKWFWLKPIQKTGVHLEYSAVLNRFLSDDLTFRKLVCDIAENVLSVYKNHENVAVPIISFSMFTIYNALEKCKSIEDELVTFLRPYFLKGLLSDFKKYTSASYMVISKIMFKVNLSLEYVETLLIKIFETLKDDLVKEACEILILAFQTQSIKALPKKVFSVLLSDSSCQESLLGLINDFKAFSLIKAIIKRTVFMVNLSTFAKIDKGSKTLKFLKKFLKCVKLDEKCVLFCFNTAVKKIVKCTKEKKSKITFKPMKKIAKCVFQSLEHKYPDHFDKAYKKLLEKKSYVSVLCNLINKSVCSMKYEVIQDIKTSLALGLYHANSQIRQTSVAYLIQLISSQKINDKEFVKNSLYDRLLDSSPKVVLEILSSLDTVLHFIGKSKLLDTFKNIFTRRIRSKSEWYGIQIRCLDIIIILFKEDENLFDIFEIISNFLFPVNEHTLEGFLHLLSSDLKIDLIQELKILNLDVKKEDVTNDEIFDINCAIVRSLRKMVCQMSEASKMVYVSHLNSKISNLKSNSVLVFYIYAMQFILETSEDKSKVLLYINSFLCVLKAFFSQPNVNLEEFEILSEECVIEKCINSLNKKQFPTSLIYNAFYKLVIGFTFEFKCESWPDIASGYGDSYEILSNLFNFCILHVYSDKMLLRKYFCSMLSLLVSHQLKSIQATFWFLSTKLLNSSRYPLVQLTVIDIARSFCQGNYQMHWLFNSPMIFWCIVKAIANPTLELSHAALSLLSMCVSCVKDRSYPLKFLADEIIAKSEEIKIDYRQCFASIGNWLKEAVEYKDGKKASRISKELQNKISVLDQILNLLKEENIPYTMKYFLLSCLQNTDSVTVLSSCIPLLYYHIDLLEKSDSDKEDILNIIRLLVKKFTPKTAKCLIEKSEETKALLHCLNFTISRENDLDRSVQALTLDILNRDLFCAIGSEKIQLEIFENLIVLYMTSPLNVNTKVKKVLREICPYAYLFMKHLKEKEELDASKSTTVREAKKLKMKDNVNSSMKDDTWKKITVLLELIQSESDLLKKEILIPVLFNLLNESFKYDSEAPFEYIKQLILSAVRNCYEQMSASPQQKLECDFRVDLITTCIKTSTNSKTHHQALLLLNLGAAMFPDRVIDSVISNMSIFVFMGPNLVRQDDIYSFQVILQIIETIMPSLLKASNQQTKTDGDQVVALVIRVFVDSLTDMPGHRQLPLFTKLITTLNPSKYLWIPIGQICDKYAPAFYDITTDDSNNWEVSPTLEFAVSLHQQFSPDIQIDTCVKLIQFLLMLPDTKKQLETNPDYKKIKEPFNLEACNEKQLQIYKQNVLCYMKIWLSSHTFLNQVAELDAKEQNDLEKKYRLLLESVLGLLQDRLNVKKSSRDEMKINDQVQLLYDLVHAINSLLPCGSFIRVMRKLLENNEEEIQLRAIELLNMKLEQQKEVVSVENHKPLLKLMKPLLKLVGTCPNEEEKDSRNILIQQTALYSLHLLCKLIGSEHPTKFYRVLKVSIKILTHYNKPELIVNALLCIAQLCCCLNVDILPHLNSFMPIIINILQDKKILNLNECLVLGIITALNSIVENLGAFLSSYMADILINVCLHSVSYSQLGKKAVSERFVNLQTKLASEIPLRVLINVVVGSYLKLCHKNATSVIPLVKILTQSLDSSKYDDILSCATELQNIYMSLLDFRNCNHSLPLQMIGLVENSIISSIQTFVMKLSVTRFRTFFQKIYQWAVVSIDDQEQKFRIFTFYNVTSKFSKSLKSLFSVMSRYFFTHAASVLDSCNVFKSKIHYFDSNVELSHGLLTNVLDTLNYCFMYSEEQLLDKENFELLMHPLVNQIENLSEDGETGEVMYQELIENHLSSCIAYFMASVSDSALWKSMNYQILLRTQDTRPKVRFGALQVILEVVKQMGDNYLGLLPESIPFLAELMEDESSEVEQECQTVIVEMEKILGEPIRKSF